MVRLVEIEGKLMLAAELLVDQRDDLLEGAIFDLQLREVLNIHADHLAAFLLAHLEQPAPQVLLVDLQQPLLIGEVGLLQLVPRVTAPVHRLLVDRYVDEVLVELHHQHFVIFWVGVEVVRQFAGRAAVAIVDALCEVAVEGVEFGPVEDLAALAEKYPYLSWSWLQSSCRFSQFFRSRNLVRQCM